MLLNGVRTAAILRAERPGGKEGKRTMAHSMRESMHLISDPRNLDACVDEVFDLMLGVNCVRDAGPLQLEAESVTAVVGFGGVLSGACVFRSSGAAAITIAARMTGMEFAEVDDTVKDAIGEVCNMLAGSWKSKVPDLSANCGLSVPAVITGSNYHLHVQAPEFRLCHEYSFEDACFDVTILCDGLQ
jgi:chemotaxis protein CheX